MKIRDLPIQPPSFCAKAFSFGAREEISSLEIREPTSLGTLQAFETKPKQRIFSAWNHTPMGYSLPASIGACFASQKEVICSHRRRGLSHDVFAGAGHNPPPQPLPFAFLFLTTMGTPFRSKPIDNWLEYRTIAVG